MENENRIIIPEGFNIVVDDVGFWLAGDERYYVKVPESAIHQSKRPYYFEDYRSLVEIGKALNMRILCGFTNGEWDRDAILAKVPGSNMYGSWWTNSEPLKNTERFDAVRDYVNSNSLYIEMAVHGLNHMYWPDDSDTYSSAEYYYRVDGVNYMRDPDIMRMHLDAWFEIYNRNGFSAKVDKFIPCCFLYNYSSGDDELSYILKDYGIRYISTIFSGMGPNTPDKPTLAAIENGILTTDRTHDLSAWYELDAKTPDTLKSSCYGAHWQHFAALDPCDNMKTVARWVEYFKQYKNKFDVLFARDHEMSAKQTFYRRFTNVIRGAENCFTLDFAEADKQGAPADVIGNAIYINVKKPYSIHQHDGSCKVELYDVSDDFCTYKLTRYGTFANIKLK